MFAQVISAVAWELRAYHTNPLFSLPPVFTPPADGQQFTVSKDLSLLQQCLFTNRTTVSHLGALLSFPMQIPPTLKQPQLAICLPT